MPFHTSLHLSLCLAIFWIHPLPSSMCHDHYISFSLSLHVFSMIQCRFSICPTYVCHTYSNSYFFCPDILNQLYSHHPSQHPHIDLLFQPSLVHPFSLTISRSNTSQDGWCRSDAVTLCIMGILLSSLNSPNVTSCSPIEGRL